MSFRAISMSHVAYVLVADVCDADGSDADGILVLVLYGVGRAEIWVLCIIRINIILNIIRIVLCGPRPGGRVIQSGPAVKRTEH